MADDYKAPAPIETSIGGPLVLWIAFLIVGVILLLVVAPLVSSNRLAYNLVRSISNWILYLPGSLVLPLIISVWMGESVGKNRVGIGRSARIGEVNAVYVAMVYVITIIIIYLVFYYINPVAVSSVSLTDFVEFSVALPVVIVLVLTPIVAALSAARHSSL